MCVLHNVIISVIVRIETTPFTVYVVLNLEDRTLQRETIQGHMVDQLPQFF